MFERLDCLDAFVFSSRVTEKPDERIPVYVVLRKLIASA